MGSVYTEPHLKLLTLHGCKKRWRKKYLKTFKNR